MSKEPITITRFLRWTLISIFSLSLLLGSVYLWWENQSNTLHIALVGPMTGDYSAVGTEMKRGADAYLKQLESAGLLNEKHINLVVYDDQNDPKIAQSIAREIVLRQDILLVLGHYQRETSLAASDFYRDAGIPVISGSTTADDVVETNRWFFSLLPTDGNQGALIAVYMNKILGAKKAAIVFDNNAYGKALAEGFETTARQLQMDISLRLSFDGKSSQLETELEQVAAKVRESKDLGLIFLATEARQGVSLITSLHGLGLKFFGPDSFSGKAFLAELKTYPQEQVKPGYFIDGIYSTLPFLSDIAQKKTMEFKIDFEKEFKQQPTLVAAGYHDAVMLAVHAISKVFNADKHQSPDILRSDIRNFLASMTMSDKAITGVTGEILFDAFGASLKPMPVGIFRGHRLVAYREQLQLVRNEQRIDNLLKDILEGRMLLVNRQLMHRTRVVYTGIDFNEISNVDTKNSTFSADFFLWFRTDLDLDAREIEFLNSVNPIHLDEPILVEDNGDGLVTTTYPVRAVFRGEFNFYRYPFDSQELSIRFRNSTTRDQLIFVPDVLGMRDSEKTAATIRAGFESVSGWRFGNTLFYQDEISSDSSFGVERFFGNQVSLEYSRFNAVVKIQRDAAGFILKNLFPMFFVLLLSYLTFYVTIFNPRLNTIATALLTTAFFHLKFSDALPVSYLVALEYFFFGVYALIGIALLAAIFFHRMAERYDKFGESAKAGVMLSHRVDMIGRWSFPVLVVMMSYGIIFVFAGD